MSEPTTQSKSMQPQPDFRRDIMFLYEMGSIRFMERMWRRFLNGDFANLAEHHFRVMWIALTIAAREPKADSAKVAKLALVHDIAESRTGDVDYLARQYVERNEKLAIEDMLGGTVLADEFLELWREYEERQTLESKIVKDADNVDVDMELAERAANGSRLEELWYKNRAFVAENRLYTETARRLVAQLKQVDPHSWHAEGRNRRNGGDWQK